MMRTEKRVNVIGETNNVHSCYISIGNLVVSVTLSGTFKLARVLQCWTWLELIARIPMLIFLRNLEYQLGILVAHLPLCGLLLFHHHMIK